MNNPNQTSDPAQLRAFAGQCNGLKTDKEVPGALSELDQSVAQLSASLVELLDRLAPIMMQQIPHGTTACAETEFFCGLARDIGCCYEQINTMHSAICDALHRLQI